MKPWFSISGLKRHAVDVTPQRFATQLMPARSPEDAPGGLGQHQRPGLPACPYAPVFSVLRRSALGRMASVAS
jgi:hypothetical protein